MHLVYRLANISEIEKIYSLYSNSISNMISQGIFQWDEIYPDKEVLIGDIEKKHMYIFLNEEEIVSVVVLNNEQDKEYDSADWNYPNENVAVIHRLCVHVNFQGKGVGTKTMLLAESILKNNGYKSIRLDTFFQNSYALRLYDKLNYFRVGQVEFRKGIFYLYEKVL